MHVITVTFKTNPGHEAAFLARVRQQAEDSLAREELCHQFDVCTHDDNSNEVFLYEIYEDPAAFQAHLDSQHFLDFSRDIQDMVADKTVTSWRRIFP